MKIKLVVRLRTQNYMSGNSIVSSKTATLMMRKSNGLMSDLIIEPSLDIPDMNLHEFEDGLYEITTTDHEYDRETGTLDGYRLTLTPHKDDNDE